MHIKELSVAEFENFVNKSPLSNHYQTMNYALLMGENGYDYELIGLVDEYETIHAASLILIKKITKILKYGYAPKGFILDYFDNNLLREFTKCIKEYYKKKLVFIKINPEIAIAEINPTNFEKNYNQNAEIKDYLINLGYVKLKDNLYFESMVPRFNAILNLKNYELNKIDKTTRNKIKRAKSKGLEIEIGKQKDLDILYNFVKNKRNKDSFYYKDYYNIFSKTNSIDLFLVSLNPNKYLVNSKENYEKELEKNTKYNDEIITNKSEKKLNIKMNSDKKLLAYKNDIMQASSMDKEKIYIAGALVIKHKNRINIIISGYDPKYKRFNPNYYLHHKIFEYYKENYTHADLNGITGDFTKNNPYKGLNEFKLGFKPKIYEFLGEYDLMIKPSTYTSLLKSGKLAKIFNKDDIKK